MRAEVTVRTILDAARDILAPENTGKYFGSHPQTLVIDVNYIVRPRVQSDPFVITEDTPDETETKP